MDVVMGEPGLQTTESAAGTPGDPEAWIDQAFAGLSGDPDAAQALAARALAAVPADSSAAGRARHILGMASCLLGQVPAGCEQLRLASELLDRHGPAHAAGRAWRDRGSVLTHLSGDLPGGLAAMERALAIVQTLGDRHEEGILLARLGPVLGHIGRHDDSRRMLERAVALLADCPDIDARASALDNFGCQHLLTGDYAAALPLFRAERALRKVTGDRIHLANCDANLAIALAGTGQGDEARALLADLDQRLDAATDGHQWVDYRLTAGRVALLSGHPQDALEPLREGLQAAREQGLHRIEVDLLGYLAQAQEATGDLQAALLSERTLRMAERQWLDAQSTARLQSLESNLALVRERAERQALEQARSELEQRVEERTAELQDQMREREAAQDMARFWADHDWLTRLPNRRQLKAALDTMLSQARAAGTELGLLFVDLDGFKEVNDAHGHLVGDHLLRVTARRLVRHATPGALVTRFGGDEFVVLLPGLATPDDVVTAAQRLRGAVLAPMRIQRRPVRLSCSIGVAIGPRDASTPEELLRRADQAMLEAKAAGRNRVLALDVGGQLRLDRRSRIRRELGAAIEDGRLVPAFQPLWDTHQRCLAGVELLARWTDPELGPVSPAEFIPLAEESGLVGRLGVWAVAQASAAARALHEGGALPFPAPRRVAVNLSTVQLTHTGLVEDLRLAVEQAGGEPGWLQLELTESQQLAEDPSVQQRLRDLQALGFNLAIDDFGAGYSSFTYLSRDFFDRLKIDRGLLEAATANPTRIAVIGSIVAMARRLGLDVVGEGVETAAQLELLRSQGCDVVQGFHIARPMPLADLLAWPGPP
jgi:diguanylate cyclase (GGDEF)-like protein